MTQPTPPAPVVTGGAIVAGGSPAVTSSASLAAQAALAASFYAAQAWLATAATRDVLQIWQALNLRDVRQSWPALRTALAALIRDRHGQAAVLGIGYYQQARRAAGVLGEAPRVVVPPPPEPLITATLDSTGPYGLLGRIKTGQQVAAANENTGVVMSGAAQRLITNGARQAVLQSVEEDAKAVAWMRVTSAHPCAFCAMLASRGAVYRSEKTAEFQAHSHCVPAGTLVQGPATEAAYRRWYEGELIVASTSAGHKLSVTPNHPVLTSQGWVPAGLLREGDEVLTSLGAQWCTPDSPDEQQRPALIEDVWGALSVRGLVGMPVAAEDFHGDGADGEVDVVFADGLLPGRLDAVSAEPRIECLLVGAGAPVPSGDFLGLRHAHEALFGELGSANGRMGGGGVGGTLFGGQPGIAEQLGRANATDLDLLLKQAAADYAAIYAESLSQGEFGLAGAVQVADGGGGEPGAVAACIDASLAQFAAEDRFGHASLGGDLLGGCPGAVGLDGRAEFVPVGAVGSRRFDPGRFDGLPERRDAYARLGTGLVERLAGRVERDRIAQLRRVDFSGHVYNLQTAEGWYEAAGIIVSNCACVAMPVFSHIVASASHHNPLYDQWREATKGKSGKDALRAWRQHWDAQQNRDGLRVLPAA